MEIVEIWSEHLTRSLKEAGLAVVAFFFLREIVAIGIVSASAIFDGAPNDGVIWTYFGVAYFPLLILCILIVARAGREQSLLWPPLVQRPAQRWLLIGGALSVACLTSEYILFQLAGAEGGDAAWVQQSLYEDDVLHRTAFISLVAVIGPVAEEFFFRGVLFRFARQYSPFLFSSALISLLFAAYHIRFWDYELVGASIAIGMTFLMSMSACYVVERSQSIWPAVLLHSLKNSLALAVVGCYASS